MRRSGTGSITKLEDKPRSKCRKWKLRVSTNKGERSRRFTGTYSCAEIALNEFIAELEISTKAVTFDEYASQWIARRRRSQDIQASTVASNETEVRRLRGVFGSCYLHELNRSTIEDGLDRIRNGENASGAMLSGTTMNKAYSVLSQILQSAYLDDVIPSNPCRAVKAPKKDTKEKRAIPPDELRAFLSRLYSAPLTSHTVAVRIAVLAGLRRGEIVALRWGDIENGCIMVRSSIDERTGLRKSPKTSAGFRSVPMLPELARDIDAWHDSLSDFFTSLGEELSDSDPVVISSTGKPMRAQNLYRWWINNRWEFGADASLHELRHTFLTMLASSGANAAVLKSVAGWSDLSVASTYIHDDVEASKRAIDSLAQVLVQETVQV